MLAIPTAARALFAAGLLAANAASLGALPVVPAHRSAAPAPSELRGVFRVRLEEAGQMPVPATILFEQRAGQMSASLLIDERVSPMLAVEQDGQTVRATVNTDKGAATLLLRVVGDSVDGTITAKKHSWKVTGERSA